MEKGLFSKEILEVISRNIKIFIVTAILFFAGAAWKIISLPQEYRAISYFRYMGTEPGEITVKKDNNGTITLVKYELGKGNLDIQTLFRSPEFNQIKGSNRARLTFDSGNGNHILEITGRDKREVLNISGKYLEKFQEKNREFLQKKIALETETVSREKLVFELENEERSFPLLIRAEKVEEVEKGREIALFFALVTGIFLGIIGAFIAQTVRELRGES